MTDIFSQILPALKMAAPTVAGLLGGPLAGMGVQALEGAFGMAPGADPKAIIDAVSTMTPDTAIKLAQTDADLKAKLADAGIQYETIAAGDRLSAREREMTVKDLTPRLLAIFVSIGFFSLLGLLAFHSVPNEARDLLNTMLGSLGAGWLMIMAYYFGSSAGSARKDETIGNLTK